MAAQFQVRQHLRDVNGQQFFNTLNFDDEVFFDNEIHAICERELYLFVNYGQPDLVFYMQSRSGQFIKQACANGTFKHSGTKSIVNLKGAVDDCVTRFVWTHHGSGLRVLGVLCGE